MTLLPHQKGILVGILPFALAALLVFGRPHLPRYGTTLALVAGAVLLFVLTRGGDHHGP